MFLEGTWCGRGDIFVSGSGDVCRVSAGSWCVGTGTWGRNKYGNTRGCPGRSGGRSSGSTPFIGTGFLGSTRRRQETGSTRSCSGCTVFIART